MLSRDSRCRACQVSASNSTSLRLLASDPFADRFGMRSDPFSGTGSDPVSLCHRRFELIEEVRLLPREPTLFVRLAAEVAIGGRARIDRLVEIEVFADAARGEVYELDQHLLELGAVDLVGVGAQ